MPNIHRPAAACDAEHQADNGRGHGGQRMAMQGLAEIELGAEGGDEAGDEHDQHIGNRCVAERQDEGHEGAG